MNGGEVDEKRVAVACALTRQNLKVVDYIIFSGEVLDRGGIDREHSAGKTPDAAINLCWHYDMVELTAGKIVDFAETLIMSENVEPQRITAVQIKKLAQDGLKAGQLDPDKIRSEYIRKKLGI